MNTGRRTYLLIALVIVASIVSAIAGARMERSRDAAEASARDLSESRALLADLATTPAAPARAGELDPAELSRRLHDAAQNAGIPDPGSIEPGSPARAAQSDFEELPVFVRLDALTLKQLVTFLHQLAENDPSCRTRTIELSIPEGSSAVSAAAGAATGSTRNGNSPEPWSADVTLAYRIYAPRLESPRNP